MPSDAPTSAENDRFPKITSEVMELLGKYQSRKILGSKFQNDMLHIAVATIADADVLVSWNFRHIVRLDKIVSSTQSI